MKTKRSYSMEELLRGDAGLEMQEFGKDFCMNYRGTINKGEERELRNLLQGEKRGRTAEQVVSPAIAMEDPATERIRLRMEVLKRLH